MHFARVMNISLEITILLRNNPPPYIVVAGSLITLWLRNIAIWRKPD